MPRQCLDLLYSLDIPTDFIVGNGDRETAAAARGPVPSIIPEFFRDAMTWNAAHLQPRDLEAIDSWPLTRQRTIDGQAYQNHISIAMGSRGELDRARDLLQEWLDQKRGKPGLDTTTRPRATIAG